MLRHNKGRLETSKWELDKAWKKLDKLGQAWYSSVKFTLAWVSSSSWTTSSLRWDSQQPADLSWVEGWSIGQVARVVGGYQAVGEGSCGQGVFDGF